MRAPRPKRQPVRAARGCCGLQFGDVLGSSAEKEKQHNVEHAVQLYGEIIAKYPRSDYAGKAAERLTVLQK